MDAAASRTLTIRAPRAPDMAQLTRIHAEGLATGHASFRAEPYGATDFADTFGQGVLLLAEGPGGPVGWAGAAPTSDRCTYRGVAEVSVYVAANAAGRGVGRALLADLIVAAEDAGVWTLVAQCFPENAASVRLHRNGGFEALGLRRGLGRMTYGPMAGRRRDVLMLERRSAVVGRG